MFLESLSRQMLHSHWFPINCNTGSTVTSSLNITFSVSRLSWKLVISLPESDESLAVEDQHRSDWLKAKFSKGAVSSSSLDEKVSFIVKMMQITVINTIYVIIRLLLDHLIIHNFVKFIEFNFSMYFLNNFSLTVYFLANTLICKIHNHGYP